MPVRFLVSVFLVLVSAVGLLAQERASRLQEGAESRGPLPRVDARSSNYGSAPAGMAPQPRVLSLRLPQGAARGGASVLRAGRSARELLMDLRDQAGLTPSQAAQMRLLRESGANSPAWADFQQTIDNIPVFEGLMRVSLPLNGDVVALTLPGLLPSRLNTVLARVTPVEAVQLAFRAARVVLPAEPLDSLPVENADLSFRNPLGDGRDPLLLDLVAFPMDNESARLGWRVHFDGGSGRRAEMVIDAVSGQLLYCQSIERHAGTARVWRLAPNRGDRVTVSFPDSWLTATQTQTNGNNVDAYLDTDGNNAPDSLTETGIRQGRAASDSQVFDFPAPSTTANDDPRKYRPAAVTNAFYLANVAHDFFYALGFDEAAGNFQRDNGGRGGQGNDPVRVEVQDRFQKDNAGFLLAREGSSPRMELGLASRGTALAEDDRDYAYDSGIIFHEYSHGVTNRVVGGGTTLGCLVGTQSGALDEGWADYFASSYTNDPILSSYLAESPNGIRRRSYEGYPFTYEDLGNDGFEVHDDGEIWAATLWDIRKALGAPSTDKLIYTALRQTPCRATFPAARDAILGADQTLNAGANRARLWEIFARRGLGVSASGVDGLFGVGTVYNAAFDLPSDLRAGNRSPVMTSTPPLSVSGRQEVSYQIQATDPDGDPVTYELLSGPTGMTVDRSTGLLKWNSGFLAARAKVAVTDGKGGRVIHGFNILVVTALRPGETVSLSVPRRGDEALVSIDVPADTPVLQLTAREGTGDVDFFVYGPNGEDESGEPRNGSFETVSVGNPAAGRWVASVYAYRAFENVRITASLPVPRLLRGNDSAAGLSGETSSETFFRLAVPPGANSLIVTTAGGSGDVDLLVNPVKPPVCQTYDDFSGFSCFLARGLSNNFRNGERIQIDAPQAGNWYINLSAAQGYTGVTLTTAMSVRPVLVVDPAGTITFNVAEGGPTPTPRIIKITDPSGSKFDWTATVSPAAPWLRLSADKGSGDSDLTLSVSTAGLATGTYRTALTIAGVALANSPQTINIVLNYTRPASISVGAAALNFTAPAGVNPAVQTLEISNTGGGTLEWTVTPTTTSGGNWLFVDQPRGTGNTRLQVIVRAGSLPPGDYDGALAIAATGAAPVTVRVRYTVTVAVTLNDASLRSAASFREGWALSPGELVTVSGSNLSAACSPCVPSPYPLPTESGGLRMLVNGVPAPLVFVSPGQVRFVVPFEVSGPEVRIVASRGGATSTALVRALEPQAIGVFTVLEGGAGAGRLFRADGSLVTAAAPLQAGEVVTIQATGLGAVSPVVANGAAGPADPLAQVAAPVQVYLDGVEAAVDSAYLEPGLAGVYRIRLTVPSGLPRKYPIVVVQSATSQSQEVTAGGPTLAPFESSFTVAAGSSPSITLRGLNLPAGAAVLVGETSVPAEAGDATADGLQTLRVTVPATLLPPANGEVLLRVADPANPAEAPSNPIPLRVR